MPVSATPAASAELSREIDQLGRLCGDTIRELAGDASFELVEQVRRLAREMQGDKPEAAAELDALLKSLAPEQIEVVARSFTVFLELANLAEDRQRVRVLRRREREAYPEPPGETIRAAIAEYHRRGFSSQQVQAFVDKAHIELVLTAHPTEAKRRAVRRLTTEMRTQLGKLDSADLLPGEKDALLAQLAAQMRRLAQTDLLRPWRPTVLQEVERGLSIRQVLWSEAPRIIDELREALAEFYPKVKFACPGAPVRPLIKYGSWIGGDRDGNPFVTPEVTAKTLRWMRSMAFEMHLKHCRRVSRALSLSDRQSPPSAELTDAIVAAGRRWPELADQLESLSPLESYRRWLHLVAWRLEQTSQLSLKALPSRASALYNSADDLLADLEILADSLRETGNVSIYETEVQPWMDQIRIFGFHTARLDIRQDSSVYRQVLNEVWKLTGDCEEPEKLDEPARQRLLVETLGKPFTPPPKGSKQEAFSDLARETFELFTLLRRVTRVYGLDALGSHVVSMTRVPSDLLVVLWLWRWSEQVERNAASDTSRDAEMHLPLQPLFETIDDLRRAPETLATLLAEPTYREYVAQQGDRQTAMIGYSDSTKDGGYLAAQWALQAGQAGLVKVANAAGVDLTFFHGRGGSLGRGGGPAAKSVLSLPTEAFNGTLQLTEQGEVLADRYDNAHIAHRHLEQLAWAVLTAVSRDPSPPPHQWQERVEKLAELSLTAYRKLVDHPSFAHFYRAVTPINAIEQLPISSRPSKRKGGNRIEDLRAIPWVYSWTQCRCLLPAWYGLGSAYEAYVGEDAGKAEELKQLVDEWPFFRIVVDNATQALALANMRVFAKYAELAEDMDGGEVEGCRELADSIIAEFDRTRAAVLALTGSSELLDSVPWLQRSIKVRNGYVDPLNLLQVELIRRGRAASSLESGSPSKTPSGTTPANADGEAHVERNQWEHLTHLTVKGVSTGMRTTG